MTNSIENGTKREVDGRLCVYYDGYWIRSYTPPQESLAARQTLIFHLTRRTFHHTEAGINTPGDNWTLPGTPSTTNPTPPASESKAPCWPVRCSTG